MESSQAALLTCVSKTRAGILPYLACLTHHSRGSALLHQIMDPDSGGGPPLYIEPSFPHDSVWDCMNVCCGMQPSQLYYLIGECFRGHHSSVHGCSGQ